MKRQTAESIVDAYARAIELSCEELQQAAKPKLDGVLDALRDFIVLELSDEREDAMSDLLAKCDWNGDELRVELPQWPEVVTVWVDGKAMPFAPVTTDIAEEIKSKVKAWSEVAELEGTIECLKGLADATSVENTKLRELVRDMTEAFIHGNCYRWCEAEPCNFISDGKCQFLDRMRVLGVEEDA